MPRLIVTTLPILLATSLFAVSGGTYGKDKECSNGTIKGDYWTVLDGTVFLAPFVGYNMPAAGSGLLSFDGKGACVFSGTVNIGGAITNVDATKFVSCTYSVFPDCTSEQTTVLKDVNVPGGTVSLTAESNFGVVSKAKELPFELSASVNGAPLIVTGTAQKTEDD